MAPFKSKACREGTLNKTFIFLHFPKFVLQKSAERLPSGNRRRLKIESLNEFGLLCHPDENLAAFSPDAIAGVVEELAEGPSRFVALVEMKSKCTAATLTREMSFLGVLGEYQDINADEDPKLFKTSFPDALYRCQHLHGMAPGTLKMPSMLLHHYGRYSASFTFELVRLCKNSIFR